MVKVPILKPDGSKKGDVELPATFAEDLRPDLVHKAVRVAQSNRRQAYGSAPMAGAMHSTKSAGKGKGMSRVPRIGGSGPGALAPPTVGGRRAHPPEARRVWTEKINNKERRLAIRSAIAATADRALVTARGHRIDDKLALPVVVDAGFEKIEKAQDVIAALEKIGLGADLERASAGVHVRACANPLPSSSSPRTPAASCAARATFPASTWSHRRTSTPRCSPPAASRDG
jgi:large subunit ribosomal protein L4e